jgi:hypothetical protein
MAHNGDDTKIFLENLKQMPFIQVACKNTSISRATIYRWMKDNDRFRRKVQKAIKTGREGLIEIAEIALVKKFRSGDMNAIKFFLQHNSKQYRTKMLVYEKEAEKDPTSAFVGPDGNILISKQAADLIKKEDLERNRRKGRALGWRDNDEEDEYE